MPDQLQLRGGTTTEHNSFTGAAREVTVDTTKKTLVVHDGSQAGGTPLMKESGGNAATSVGIGTGGTNAININSSQKVGIGTASPARKFEVHDTNATVLALNSTNSSGTTLRIQNGGTDKLFLGLAGDFITGQSTNVTDSAIRTSGALLFATGGSNERMRIDSSGNLGIGTTSPETLLHAKINTFSDDINKVALTLSNNQSSGVHQYFQNASTGTGVSNGARIGLGNTDNFLIQHFEAKDIQISTNGTERMRIDSSGNVGIGTASPSHKLHVVSSGTDTAFFKGRIIRFDGAAASNSPRLNLSLDGTDKTSILLNRTDSSLAIETLTAAPIIFDTNSTERMRIHPSSNQLQIGGTTLINSNPYLTLGQAANSQGDVFHIINNGTADLKQAFIAAGKTSRQIGIDVSANTFYIGRDSSVQDLTVNSSGNVGIGTTSPQSILSVKVSASRQLDVIKDSGDDHLVLKSTAPDASYNMRSIELAGADVSFSTGASSGTSYTERMRIDSSGRLLVGSSSISNNGRIQGFIDHGSTAGESGITSVDTTAMAAGVGGEISFMGKTNTSGDYNYVGHVRGIKENATSGNTACALTFHTRPTLTAPQERMRIDSSGRLLVGATSKEFQEFLLVKKGGASVNVATFFFNNVQDEADVIVKHDRATGGQAATMIEFIDQHNTSSGKIRSDGSSTSYDTSSDYRLKENAVAISDGITRLKTLKPYRFNFKVNPTKTVDGFFAHEVTAVPEAISGEKDGMKPLTFYEEGDTIPSGKQVGDAKTFSETEIKAQTIDQSKLVPLLVAAVQELITKVAALEAA